MPLVALNPPTTANNQISFNLSGAYTSTPSLTFNPATNILSTPGVEAKNVRVDGNFSVFNASGESVIRCESDTTNHITLGDPSAHSIGLKTYGSNVVTDSSSNNAVVINAGSVVFQNASGIVVLQSLPTTSFYTLTLPVDAGSNGYVLTTDGTGGLSWVQPTSTPDVSNLINNQIPDILARIAALERERV
jgi:hypothetical protein